MSNTTLNNRVCAATAAIFCLHFAGQVMAAEVNSLDQDTQALKSSVLELSNELAVLEEYLQTPDWHSKVSEDKMVEKHLEWCKELSEENEFTYKNAQEILRKNVGEKFSTVLEHAGVFKRDIRGQEAFDRFIEKVSS